MSEKPRFDFMSLVDDKFIAEADPYAPNPAYKSRFKWSHILLISLCLLLVINIAVLLPILLREDSPVAPTPPSSNVTISSGDLNQVPNPGTPGGSTEQKPSGNTNLVANDALLEALKNLFEANGSNSLIVENGEIEGMVTPPYETVTEGGSLGDLAVYTDTHLFYLKDKALYIYTLDGADSALAGMYPLDGYITELVSYAKSTLGNSLVSLPLENNNYALDKDWKMLLSPDGKTITIILIPNNHNMTGVLTFDISDAPTVRLRDYKIFSGEFISAHIENGEMMLFTRYYVRSSFSKDKPSSYVPFYKQGGSEHFAQNVFFPAELNSSAYLMVSRLDATGDTVKDTCAYLSYSDRLYVSSDKIFITRNVFVGEENVAYITPPYETEIVYVDYKNGTFENKGTVNVNGYIYGDSNMSEQKGILHIATSSYVAKQDSPHDWYEKSVSLFVIDLSSMKIIGKAENFADEGASLQSVSFWNGHAYLRVILENSSTPVYDFDLSDPKNLTYTDKSEDFIGALIDFGGGYYLRIGAGSNSQSLKIQLFMKQEGVMSLLDTYELSNTYFPQNGESYYIDRDNHLLGFAIRTYDKNAQSRYVNKYVLLSFKENLFETVLTREECFTLRESCRSIYKNGYLYLITDKEFCPVGINEANN